MSFIRRIVRLGGGQQGVVEAPTTKPQDNALGLSHLKKLFADFRSANSSQREQEDKLYNMLPLFCKLFYNMPANSMMEKFGDILQFCSHVSKLMVTEVRRRASDQTTVAASCAIVKFLEIDSTEEASQGWMLLSTINLLSMSNGALIDCMTAASLPSTLVKCLYLFFDLPEITDPDTAQQGSEYTPKERRILLQKIFVQVLVRLCNHVSPAEELARKDDLSLLFSAITSWCHSHNSIWRKSAGEVLVTLSRHGLTQNVVKYIHDKGCVRHCVENMQRAQDLSPLDLVEMFVTVFCFLKDSSEQSQILLDDFRSCKGYDDLSEFILKLEKDEAEESVQALRNLVLLVGSITTCGHTELKPSQASSSSLFKIPGFHVPQPAGKGDSVRNLHAFLVLQNLFIKANTSHLCNTILDVISSIYHQDSANYFILEPQHTLSQFAEKIHLKAPDIQEKFFELLEFIVFNLNFVPCKELISLSIVIKTQHSIESCIRCIKSLQRVLTFHVVFKDVFRDVGLLEVLVTCLQKFSALLKDPHADGGFITSDNVRITKEQRELGFLVMEVLSTLLNGSNQNASVFREVGGARCAHNMVPHKECRQFALNIVQQLVLSPGGDDDMGTLLGLMHSAEKTSLELKACILKSLLNVLRESHRTRTVFRKVGGFVYVMSVLVSMEGCLSDPPASPWDEVSRQEILSMLKTLFSTITVAMRYEPANAKFFATEVRYDSLTEGVRLMGCFSNEADIQPVDEDIIQPDETLVFEDFFLHCKESRLASQVPVTLLSACTLIRYLYDMALDTFDRPYLGQQKSTESPLQKRSTVLYEKSDSHGSPKPKRASTGSIVLPVALHGEHIIHAGAVKSMFHLLPAISCQESLKLCVDLQVSLSRVLKSLLRKEHNQQVMCDAGFPHELLSHGNSALADESHPTHPSLQYMFERLAAQSLTPRDLRDFMRLGSPLNCRPQDDDDDQPPNSPWGTTWPLSRHSSVDEKRTPYEVEKKLKTTGCPVPLTRVKCLVSMTTPRDARTHGSTVTPAFVEFDMGLEGFGCLYLPSIAPQGPPTPSVVSGVVGASDPTVIGGIGSGERVFPPQSGLTFSTWFCVDRFSNPLVDAHPVRLFTIVRNLQGRDENLICLSVSLTPKNKSLIVCTQETNMAALAATTTEDVEPVMNDNTVKFWHQEFDQEGQWHHLVLIFHRAGIMKNSSVSLFVDGDHVNTQKLHYVSPNLGVGGIASPTAFTSVFSYIGTPPQMRRQSRLVWRQGPCHLMEDVVSSTTVKSIYTLGPTYIGSFQAPYLEDKDLQGPFVSEEKLVFGINAHAMSKLTVSKIRKVYSKFDSKSIAKQLAMSQHENATPIRLLHNSAGHLGGYARCLGAILMGYLGVRTFCSKPVAKILQNVGGTSSLLGLVAMATDVEGLYAAVKALVCVVKSNRQAMHDLDRIHGYQMLAMLYKKKQQLLNSHILHLTFSLVGTIDSGKESSVIPNKRAFEDLLCDLEVWHEAPGDLQRSLYEHFYELLTDSSDQTSNHRLMRKIGLSNRMLYIMRDPRLPITTVETMASVISILLEGSPDPTALLRLGQFLVSTIPVSTFMEKSLVVDNFTSPSGNYVIVETEEPGGSSAHKVRLRNACLQIIHRQIVQTLNSTFQFSEEVQRVLGFDWILMFMQRHLHSSTVVQALKILLAMFKNPQTVNRFREGSQGGGSLKDTETILKQKMNSMLGFNLGNSHHYNKQMLNTEICSVPGFTALQWLLPKHNNESDIYFLLIAMLLGQHIQEVPADIQLNLEAVWSVIFGSKPMSASVDLTPDAAIVLLTMVRSMLNPAHEDADSSNKDYPVTLLQFLLSLYHNQSDFILLATQPDFISALAATLFPYFMPDVEECVTTPEEEFRPFPESDGMVFVKSPDKDKACFLTGHPARQFVINFIRTVLIDSLSQAPAAKSAAVIDIMLEASPEHATRAQHKEYQTEMLRTLMEYLLAADVLLGDQAALPIMYGGNYNNMANSVFYLASRVVDKLWQGIYTRESKEIFDFISKLISQAKRKSSGLSLDSVYRALNRTVLFQLSRPVDNVANQRQVQDALHKLTTNRSLVFGPGNYDQEFLGCLCYCLLTLTDDAATSGYNINEEHPIQTTWHMHMNTGSQGQSPQAGTRKSQTVTEGMNLVSRAAKRVWEELYICKKPILEEMFRTQLNNIDVNKAESYTAPDLAAVRPLIQEPASKIWVTFAESERRGTFTMADRLPAQIESTLKKMGSGILHLATRKQKKELPLKSSPSTSIHVHDYLEWTKIHVMIIKELSDLQFKQYLQAQSHMSGYLAEEWAQIEHELLRERGLWGPSVGSRLDKWMSDMTEGPFRMRKKMVKNDMFYIHYPFRPDMVDSPLKYKVAICSDSRAYYEQYRSQTLFGEDVMPIKLGLEELSTIDADTEDKSPDDIMKIPKLLPIKHGKSQSEADEDQDEGEGEKTEASEQSEGTEPQTENPVEPPDAQTNKPGGDNQAVLRLLGEEEKISHMFRCARIQGLDTAEGLLLFGKEHFHVIDGFTLLATKEIKDIDSLPAELHDPIIPKGSRGAAQKKTYSKFAYENVKEVHKRRYLLQPIAIEVFSTDGRNYLLSFPRKVRNKVYSKFMSVATAITDNAQQSVAGQKQNAKIESGSGIISSLMGEKSVTQRWERGEINNFQYLMHLNTLAGRSYNDLMQYPVFPWVLADYDSEELDLTSPSTFRDLGRPMGGQTPDRLKQFMKRYKDWDDPQGETPPYHYGTHYSSAMIVASYLLRMEPFTQTFLNLQGGHFDLADRMFHSVKENWLSASKNNMADVKELIPEFFYLPEFLVNCNHFDLGAKQSGVQLDDVVLPPWAKGDPREFIRVHREALECDYVSAHLHEWIDLIFGNKQQGQPAVDSVNIFHHLFYEGNVDIYSIDDPLKKNATIGFINNFGQIPKQIFKRPHPQKKLNLRLVELSAGAMSTAAAERLFFNHVDNLKPCMQPVKELRGEVGQIMHNDRTVLAVEQNKVLIPPTYNRYLAWGFSDLSVRIGNYESEKAIAVFEGLDNGEVLCASCPNSKVFITGGCSCVVNVWEHNQKEKKVVLKQPLYGHTEPVTCVAASQAYSVIVSGSRDRTCIIWDLSRLVYVRQLRGHTAPVAAVCINELTGDIASCAGTYLHMWCINGENIACVNTASLQNNQILCVAMSQILEWDSRNVVLTGGSDGVVRMWSIEYNQVPDKKQPKKKSENVSTETKDSESNKTKAAITSKPLTINTKEKRRASCNSYGEDSSDAKDRLKDFKDPDYHMTKQIEPGSSVDSDTHFMSRAMIKSDRDGDDSNSLDQPDRDEGNMSDTSSISDIYPGEDIISNDGEVNTDNKSQRSVGVTSLDTATEALELGQGVDGEGSGSCTPSQSEPCNLSKLGEVGDMERSLSQPDLKTESATNIPLIKSLSSEFEVIGEAEVKKATSAEEIVKKYKRQTKNTLREGFQWRRQLVFRSKLTMHTAFERKDNKQPAAVTSLAISRDHRTIYVGDSRGRIFSWTVTDQPGRVVADHWTKDEGVESCPKCAVRFSFSERRHHCRNCGQVFCSKCSRYEAEIRRIRILKPVRVCEACFNILKAHQTTEAMQRR